ncbi:hypothetical protein [Lutimaribacter saemankumensis]|uniref:Resolvase, N terminal domain n=1 Tax=Lutimaribacter saemankumensis TaxID=490829 RepID=A0A1G8KAU7_9RHOB|nr:hypothetical protein [Lutimaribacter saemankumensis]SDI40469.1 hypothetical protein SAMN05421850_102470 [Lutimaribacter saemankumensis]
MRLYYALITHGPNPENWPARKLGELRPVSNLVEFHKQKAAGERFILKVEYCRNIKSQASLPKLNALLETAKRHGAFVTTDDFRRLFSRCDVAYRADLRSHLKAFGDHFVDLRTRKSFSSLSETATRQILFHDGPVTFKIKSEKKRTEPTPWGRNQVKEATKASAEVRARKANKKAEQLSEIRAELTEDRRTPTLKAIADEANVRGLTTSRGNHWTASTVQRALKRLQT